MLCAKKVDLSHQSPFLGLSPWVWASGDETMVFEDTVTQKTLKTTFYLLVIVASV